MGGEVTRGIAAWRTGECPFINRLFTSVMYSGQVAKFFSLSNRAAKGFAVMNAVKICR